MGAIIWLFATPFLVIVWAVAAWVLFGIYTDVAKALRK